MLATREASADRYLGSVNLRILGVFFHARLWHQVITGMNGWKRRV